MVNGSSLVPLVGLDIGKNVHVVGSYRSDTLEALGQPFSVTNTRAGFEQLAIHLDSLLAAYPVVELGNEPTGIYYEGFGRQIQAHFRHALDEGRLVYYLVNPHLVKLSRQALQDRRRRKSGLIDTQAIARCLQLRYQLISAVMSPKFYMCPSGWLVSRADDKSSHHSGLLTGRVIGA
jgi:transposase